MKVKILNNIEPFNDIVYDNCFYNSLFPIVKHFKIDIRYLLLNDIIIYDFDYSKIIPLDAKYISIKSLKEELKSLGIIMKPKFVTLENLVEELKFSIINDQPIILQVNGFYLRYRPDLFQKKHLCHSLLIYGFDDNKEVFWVVEHTNYEDLNYVKMSISYNDILDGYSRLSETIKDTNCSPFISFKQTHQNNQNDSQLNQYFHNNINNKDKIELGLQNLIKIIEFFQSKRTINSENLEKLFWQVNRIVNSRLAEHYKIILLIKDNNFLLKLLEDIVEKWKIVRVIVAKMYYLEQYNENKIDIICSLLNEVYELETTYVKEILLSTNY